MGVVTFGFFLFDGVQPLDFIGPWVCDDNDGNLIHKIMICFVKDVFDSWKQFSKSQVQLLTFGKTKVLKICFKKQTQQTVLVLDSPGQNCFLTNRFLAGPSNLTKWSYLPAFQLD